MSWQKQLCLGCFTIHFLLILAICCVDTFSFVAEGYTWLQRSFAAPASKLEAAVKVLTGSTLPRRNPVRDVAAVYTHAAGIEAGYEFFAPNVPDNYKLVFELYYPDGRVEYELPTVATESVGLRISALLDNVGQTRYDDLRELMVKMLAYSVWRLHPDSNRVRAVLGFIVLPTPRQFREGQKERYEFLYAYDFRFPVDAMSQTNK